MKTVKNALIFLLSVILISLVSCAAESGGEPIESEEEVILSVAGEDILTEDQKPFNEIAKAAIAEHYGISDLSALSLKEIKTNAENKETYYKYELKELFGYRARADIDVWLDKDGQLARAITDGYGDDILYFLDVLTKEILDEAAASIKQQMGEKANEFSPYFMLDDEGYLCMQVEIIEHYETPTENGTDHKHVFYSEKIIQKP